MQNNPMRTTVEAIERVSLEFPYERALMVAGAWDMFQDIIDADESTIDGLNSTDEEGFRQLIQAAKETPDLREYLNEAGVDDVSKALRWMRHLADMIDILHDLYGGECDLDIKWMEDEPDDLESYDYVWTVTPDPETYTTDEHGMCLYERKVNTFHVEADVVLHIGVDND